MTDREPTLSPCSQCHHYPCDHTGCDCDGSFHNPGPHCPRQDTAPPIMDYPTAWAFVKATKPEHHHLQCSWRTQNGALLCDCDVLDAEYMRRKAAQCLT